ncbi:MAG: hypothetical protein ACERKZ_21005 [Lachnotalea sp.]
MQHDHIEIMGLTQNNLKNISLFVPKNKIVVFAGRPTRMLEESNTITAKYLRNSL